MQSSPSPYRRLLATLLLWVLPKPSSRRPHDPLARYVADSFPSHA